MEESEEAGGEDFSPFTPCRRNTYCVQLCKQSNGIRVGGALARIHENLCMLFEQREAKLNPKNAKATFIDV